MVIIITPATETALVTWWLKNMTDKVLRDRTILSNEVITLTFSNNVWVDDICAFMNSLHIHHRFKQYSRSTSYTHDAILRACGNARWHAFLDRSFWTHTNRVTKMQKTEHHQDKVPSAKYENNRPMLKLNTFIKNKQN